MTAKAWLADDFVAHTLWLLGRVIFQICVGHCSQLMQLEAVFLG